MAKKGILIVAICTYTVYGGEWNGVISKIIEGNISKAKKQISEVLSKKDSGKEVIQISSKKIYEKEVKDIWEDIIEKLEESIKLEQEKEKLPEHSIFRKDKGSVEKDINEIFDEILELILDGELFKYRKNLRTLKDRINELEKKIIMYREKKVVAPQTSIIATTKDGYKKKIEEAEKEIQSAKESIESIKSQLSKNLQYIGVNLTPEQIDVLLSRVDGDDIIKVTITIEVLKEITNQLSEIMKESSQNLKYAKKYYGMHMVLVEMVAWIQAKLINKYNQEYIPQIEKIMDKSLRISEKTREAIDREKEPSRIAVYKQNLQTQEYTYKIAKRYREDLIEKLKQLKKSYEITMKDVELAKNTYKTVSLSDDLFKVIANSKKMLETVMKLQVPSIIPFDSEIVKKISRIAGADLHLGIITLLLKFSWITYFGHIHFTLSLGEFFPF